MSILFSFRNSFISRLRCCIPQDYSFVKYCYFLLMRAVSRFIIMLFWSINCLKRLELLQELVQHCASSIILIILHCIILCGLSVTYIFMYIIVSIYWCILIWLTSYFLQFLMHAASFIIRRVRTAAQHIFCRNVCLLGASICGHISCS